MAHQIRVADTGESFEAGPDETVLEAALRQHVQLPHECTLGGCGTCRVKVNQGNVAYREFPTGLTEEEHAEGYALACQAMAESDLDLTLSRRLAPCSPASTQTLVVKSVSSLAHDVTHLVLELAQHTELIFRAGQYANVIVPGAGHRSFSMASKPHARLIDFHIRHIEGGQFTGARLQQLRPGDTLEAELPLGTFSYHEDDYRPILVLATGTGIAPIKSMIESLLDDEGCPPVTLYWGARTRPDLYLHDEISSWAARLSEFRYVPVLSRADSDWEGRRGYVQDAAIQDLGHELAEHAIYLCGSPTMIAEAKRTLLARQASIHHIYAEGFTQRAGASISPGVSSCAQPAQAPRPPRSTRRP